MSSPIETIEGLNGYVYLRALVRLHGTPIGSIDIPVTNGRCLAAILKRAILEKHGQAITHHLLSDCLAMGSKLSGLSIEDLVHISHPVFEGPFPLVTVAVCTRDRTALLRQCLDSLLLLDYPSLDVLVVDNAPSGNSTERLVNKDYPTIRYVMEPRPGLNWARNRAIIEARGEIIAYADDDVIVDPGWVRVFVSVFSEDPEVMAVTGLVAPYELETEAQILFEKSCRGFGRGFERKWFQGDRQDGGHVVRTYAGSGEMGTGANMAYRRGLFNHIGFFDPSLDVGTPTLGGGDLEMFFRVVREGYRLVYEPNALVRHVHRRNLDQLRVQLTGWGTGLYSHLMRSALAYPQDAVALVRFGLKWFWRNHLRSFLGCLMRPSSAKGNLIAAETWGSLVSVVRYLQARSIAARIEREFGPLTQAHSLHRHLPSDAVAKRKGGIAVRSIDISQPLKPLTDVTDYSSIRMFVTQNGHLLGSLDIANHYRQISATRLRDTIVSSFNFKLLETAFAPNIDVAKSVVLEALRRHYMSAEEGSRRDIGERLPSHFSVSVVVATRDRPDQLCNCLRCLSRQETRRQVEIVVVDNNPVSGMTPHVVAEFPGVVLIRERRKGLSYARNAGIMASTGDIVITTDDDVAMPSDWLEKLITSFARDDVMIVTGNVLPLKLETNAERLFETYGGLSRGFEGREVDGSWFDSFGRRALPTWDLGSTANAAFRADIFSDPEIGLFDDALGAGTPTGCGEDTYLFYKVLKAGYTIIYEPSAYVWHEHRPDMEGLQRQIYNYSKGHVAYHLTTLIQDHDLRGALRIAVELPRWHVWRIKEWLLGRRSYPLSLTIREMFGNFVGPWALWRSRRRVKREGRSEPYLPVSQRQPDLHENLAGLGQYAEGGLPGRLHNWRNY